MAFFTLWINSKSSSSVNSLRYITSFPTAAMSTKPSLESFINPSISLSLISGSSPSQAPTNVLMPYSFAIKGINSLPSVQENDRTHLVYGAIIFILRRTCSSEMMSPGFCPSS